MQNEERKPRTDAEQIVAFLWVIFVFLFFIHFTSIVCFTEHRFLRIVLDESIVRQLIYGPSATQIISQFAFLNIDSIRRNGKPHALNGGVNEMESKMKMRNQSRQETVNK